MSRFRPLPSLAEVKELLHYDPDTGVFTWKVTRTGKARVGTVAGTSNSQGHIQILINSKRYLAHRLAWLYMTNEDPGTMTIDHINRIRDDNRYYNLRKATERQQKGNAGQRSSNTSGFPGVAWHKRCKGWRASLAVNYKHIHLGIYSDMIEAKFAYSVAAEAYWGEFMPPHARAFLNEHRDGQAHSAT